MPLEHHLYAAREVYKIVDAKGEFLGQGLVMFSFVLCPPDALVLIRLKDAHEALRRKQTRKEKQQACLLLLVGAGKVAEVRLVAVER